MPRSGIIGSDTKVSRSGRLLKPPLEFWKGARVIVDSDMNVTIQDSYLSAPSPLVVSVKTSVCPFTRVSYGQAAMSGRGMFYSF